MKPSNLYNSISLQWVKLRSTSRVRPERLNNGQTIAPPGALGLCRDADSRTQRLEKKLAHKIFPECIIVHQRIFGMIDKKPAHRKAADSHHDAQEKQHVPVYFLAENAD